MNVSVTAPSTSSSLTVWPAGEPRPGTQNNSFEPGQTVADLAMVKVGAGGKVSIFNAAGEVHVLADVAGWYDDGSGSSGARYGALAPSRVLDTRNGNGAPTGKLGADARLDLTVTGRGGVPSSGVSAVAINVTVTQPSGYSYLTAWPSGQIRPTASNLNYVPNQTVANLAVVKVGAGGKVSLYNALGDAHVIADVAGWYDDGSGTTGARYNALSPARILDTRSGEGAPAAKVGAGGSIDVAVTGRGGLPASGVTAVVMNVTAIQPSTYSYLTAWPSGQVRPSVSNLNFVTGKPAANLVVVKVGAGGKVSLYNPLGEVHVVADVAGWFDDPTVATTTTAPPTTTTIPPALPPTPASGPAVGAVVDLTWGIPRADMDRTVAEVRDAGIRWVRANQNWSAAEPNAKGLLDEGWLAETDYAVTKAREAGLDVLMPIADGVPYWASADPAKYVDAAGVRHWNKLWRPTNVSDYAAFAGAMVTRYKAMGVRVYEVWNEENHPFFWPSGPNPAEYKQLLAAAHPAIKAADPAATVLLGGLSKNDWSYLTDLYAAGAGPYFDAVSVHPYTGAVDPAWCWNQAGTTRLAKDAFCGIEEIRSTMVANGDSAKAILLTELGWSTTTAEYGVSEVIQADFLTRALAKVRASYPYVTTAFWYNFRNTFYYQDDPTELEANWGLVRSDFSAKPALAALKTFAAAAPVTAAPLMSVGDVTVVEGGSATFSVSLSAPAPLSGVTVKAATADSTATAGSDYTATAPTIAFAPGETTKSATVAGAGDAAAEGDETFVLNLFSPVGAVLADSQGVATILDDEGLPSIAVSDATVVEGEPAIFTLSLSAPAAAAASVKAVSGNATAAAGSDYTAASPDITFAVGETTKTVTVATSGDSAPEGNETFVLNLTSPVGLLLGDSQGVATVLDDEGPPTVAVSDATVVEGASASFTLTLRAAARQSVTVKASTANATASAGSDYTAAATTVSFATGETTKVVTVATSGDAAAEGNETFVLNLSSPAGAVLADAQGVATILDDEGLPALSINDVSVWEGAGGATANATFTVLLSRAASQAVNVRVATSDGTATAGTDYSATGTSVSFGAGETSKSVTVPVAGDSVPEDDETFVVNLSSPTGAALSDAQGLATVLDDEGVLGLALATVPTAISVEDTTVVEGSSATFKLSLSTPAPLLGVSVRTATTNATATAGSDYIAVGPTVGFALGETTKTVTVATTGDAAAEGDETFVLNLSSPVGATLADGQGVATILDDEGPPTISVTDATVLEGGSATFTLSLSAPTTGSSVKASTANATAVAGSDYSAAVSTVSFAAGETTKTVTVATSGDAAAEGDETFVLNLTTPVGAVLADNQGAATILDDEGIPTIAVGDVTAVEAGSAIFRLSLSTPATVAVSVRAGTADGSAVAGSDYTAAAPTVSFSVGETTKMVAVATSGDTTAEGKETFVLNLSSPVGAVLADDQGRATIIDDDG